MYKKLKKTMGTISTPLLVFGVTICSYMLWVKGQKDAVTAIYDQGYCIVHMTEIERKSYTPSRI